MSPPATSEADGPTLLEQAQKAFSNGDHKSAGTLAQEAELAGPASISREARMLIEQMSPPPLTKYLLLLSFILLGAVSALAYRS